MQKVETNGSVYEIAVKELHRVAQDEGARKQVEQEFNEARGREGARMHVTLSAIGEVDRRQLENAKATWSAIEHLTLDLQQRAQALTHLVQSFEQNSDKHFGSVHEDLKARAETLWNQINAFANAEREHYESVKTQVSGFQLAANAQLNDAKTTLWTQADTNFSALKTQGEQQILRIEQDVQQARDEIVRLVDSRMNQADASFAALRGDVEVVKFLVMDIIKDRIGRSDPKQKSF